MAKKQAKKAKAPTSRSAGKPVSKPVRKSTEVKQPKISPVTQVKAIQEKYGTGIPKHIKKELGSVRKEIRQAKQPLYTLNRKIREAPTPYYVKKYRKQRRELEAQLNPKIADLAAKREDYKILQKATATIREEQKANKRKLKSLEKKVTKADEEKDYVNLKALTYQLLKLQGIIDTMDATLGKEIKKIESEAYEPDEEEDERGYLEDPANPYTIWQAIHQLDDDLKNKGWKYFIINGKRFAADNIISISAEASRFWLIIKQPKTSTPQVLRYFNLEKSTVRYIPYK